MSVFDVSTGQTLRANARLIEMTGMTLEDLVQLYAALGGGWTDRDAIPDRTDNG